MQDDDSSKEPEPDLETWAPLAAANKRVLTKFLARPIDDAVAAAMSKPDEKQDEESHDASRGGEEKESANQDQREYVEQRLRDLAAFERKASGERF